MRFEHVALNVPDAAGMAAWYEKHLGMRAVVALEEAPYTRFLADATGRVVVELYSNTARPILDYRGIAPATFHWAFAVEDPFALRERLEQDGALRVEEAHPDEGTWILTLRDPWGIPLQLCRRARPF